MCEDLSPREDLLICGDRLRTSAETHKSIVEPRTGSRCARLREHCGNDAASVSEEVRIVCDGTPPSTIQLIHDTTIPSNDLVLDGLISK